MAKFNFNNIKVLVADDYSSFRATTNKMLDHLGVMQIDNASSGEEAIELCKEKTFDVVLCDHDLGDGRTGQHVLEEIRYLELLPPSSIFVLVSADVSRDVVMSAYECQPDDYLAKPINAQVLERRIVRLLGQREPLKPVFDALQHNDQRTAEILLTDLSISENRSAVPAQKMLGELFIEAGEYDKAEKLYSKVLSDHPLDWARLALARIKQLRGDLDGAEEELSQLLEENPLYLPAYDALSENWKGKGDDAKAQEVLSASADISPISILRQKRLADIAKENGDTLTACTALIHAVELGEKSIHGGMNDCLDLGRLVAKAPEELLDSKPSLVTDSIRALHSSRQIYSLSDSQNVVTGLVEARLQVKNGNEDKAKRMVEIYEEKSLQLNENDIEMDIERVMAMQDVGELEQADVLLRQMLQRYLYDQDALEKLDALLDEPVSEANKSLVAKVNREGIELYNQNLYDDALICFEKARCLFPKHAGIQLNMVQALLGKVKSGDASAEVRQQIYESLDLVGRIIDPDYSQYKRYKRLNEMASDLL